MAEKIKKTVVVEDSVLRSMALDPRFAEFQFLQPLARVIQTTGKQSCCGAKNKAKINAYAQAKHSVANLTGARLEKLKSLLHVEEVKVFVPSVNGKQRLLTL